MFSIITTGLLLAASALRAAPNNTMAQLGVKGVTDQIYGSDATLYSGYLIKTGPSGRLHISALPESVNSPVQMTRVIYLDADKGGDNEDFNGSATRPYATLTNAIAQATNDTVFVFAPGTYVPPSNVDRTNMYSFTFIGLNPTNTLISGMLRFNANRLAGVQDITVSLYRIAVEEIRQNQYGTLTVGLYDGASITDQITRLYDTPNSALTVYQEPATSIATALTGANVTRILTHDAVMLAYTPSDTNDWWSSILGDVPATVGEALDIQASRALVMYGTNTGQLAYWDNEKWNITSTGTPTQVLFGGEKPAFRTLGDVLTSSDLPYVATTPTDWTVFVGSIPTNVQEALDVIADYVVPAGTSEMSGQMTYWDGTNWQIVASGTTNLFLRGGVTPTFDTVYAQDVTYTAIPNTNQWHRIATTNPVNAQTALDVLAYAMPGPGLSVGSLASWNGTNWVTTTAGTTNQTLIGGTAPAWVTWYPNPAGVYPGDMIRWDGTNWVVVDAGTTNQVLTGGTTPNWTTWYPAAQGSNPGDMLYWNGTNWLGVLAGTTNQLLAGGDIPAFIDWSPVPDGTSSGDILYWSLVSNSWVNLPAPTDLGDVALFGGSVPYWSTALMTFGTNNLPFDFVPATNGVYSIGATNLQWLNGYFAGDVTVGGVSLTNALLRSGTADRRTMGDDLLMGTNTIYGAETNTTDIVVSGFGSNVNRIFSTAYEENGKPAYISQDIGSGPEFELSWYNTGVNYEWTIMQAGGGAIYYTASHDTPTPVTATNWAAVAGSAPTGIVRPLPVSSINIDANTLYGPFEVAYDATHGQQIVNYQTMTNYVAERTAGVGDVYLASNNVFTASNRFEGDIELAALTGDPYGSIVLAGWGSPDVNGTYTLITPQGSSQTWQNGLVSIYWSNGWVIYNDVETAYTESGSGAEYPWLVSEWTAVYGIGPIGTVEPSYIYTNVFDVLAGIASYNRNATNGNEIVNYQTMTNYVSDNAGDVYTASNNVFTGTNTFGKHIRVLPDGADSRVYAGNGTDYLRGFGDGIELVSAGSRVGIDIDGVYADLPSGRVLSATEGARALFGDWTITGFATVASNAVNGTQVVNYQTMTNHTSSVGTNYAVKAMYNEFTSSNRFNSDLEVKVADLNVLILANTAYAGTYMLNGTLNGRPKYTKSFGQEIYWDGTKWILYSNLQVRARGQNDVPTPDTVTLWYSGSFGFTSIVLDLKFYYDPVMAVLGGIPYAYHDATNGNEVVNYQTMTSHVAIASIPPVTNTTTKVFTQNLTSLGDFTAKEIIQVVDTNVMVVTEYAAADGSYTNVGVTGEKPRYSRGFNQDIYWGSGKWNIQSGAFNVAASAEDVATPDLVAQWNDDDLLSPSDIPLQVDPAASTVTQQFSVVNGIATVTPNATNGTQVVNYQAMTNQNYADKDVSNTFADGTTNIFDVIQTSTNFTPTGTVRLWDGALQAGYGFAASNMGTVASGNIQLGSLMTNTTSLSADSSTAGNIQQVYLLGTSSVTMTGQVYSSEQRIFATQGSKAVMQAPAPPGGLPTIASTQAGRLLQGATMTNISSVGVIQLGYLNGNLNQHSLVTNSYASIGLGAVTITNTSNAIVAGHGQTAHGDGSITAGGGFWTTNSPASDNWVVNYQTMTNMGYLTSAGDAYLASNQTFLGNNTFSSIQTIFGSVTGMVPDAGSVSLVWDASYGWMIQADRTWSHVLGESTLDPAGNYGSWGDGGSFTLVKDSETHWTVENFVAGTTGLTDPVGFTWEDKNSVVIGSSEGGVGSYSIKANRHIDTMGNVYAEKLYSRSEAYAGAEVVNYQTMTGMNYAAKSDYNVFTSSNRFDGPITLFTNKMSIVQNGDPVEIKDAGGYTVLSFWEGEHRLGGVPGGASITMPDGAAGELVSSSLGPWEMNGQAYEGDQIVNYTTATNLIGLAGTNYANAFNNTTTTQMTDQVSFPNGIYVAGTLVDGTVSSISVANVLFDGDFIPTSSNEFSIGSSNYPVKDVWVGTNTIYMGAYAVSVTTNGTISVKDTAADPTNAPMQYATEAWVLSQGYSTNAAQSALVLSGEAYVYDYTNSVTFDTPFTGTPFVTCTFATNVGEIAQIETLSRSTTNFTWQVRTGIGITTNSKFVINWMAK